jgi:hypothetical protein
VVVIVKDADEPTVSGAGRKEQAVSAGSPEQERVKLPEKPAMLELETVTVALPPAATGGGCAAVSVKSGLAMVTATTALLAETQLLSPE